MSEERIEPSGGPADRKTWRLTIMFFAALISVWGCIWIVVAYKELGEFAQGVIGPVIGMFINELKNMYNYETGTTRVAQAKDAVLTDIAKSATGTGNGSSSIKPHEMNVQGNVIVEAVKPDDPK